MPDKKQVKEGKVCFGSQLVDSALHVRKAWWQEQEAIGPIVCVFRKSGAQLAVSHLFSL